MWGHLGNRTWETEPLQLVSAPAADDRTRGHQELVVRALDGDGQAWRSLVDEFTPMMRGNARRFRLSEADCADVVQTVWMRFAEKGAGIKDTACIAGWLATTTRRESMRMASRREFPAEPDVHEPSDVSPTPEQLVIDADEASRVREALRRLPARDQRLLTLLVTAPPPAYRFIAAEMGLAVGSIGPLRARALDRLREELENLGSVGSHRGRRQHVLAEDVEQSAEEQLPETQHRLRPLGKATGAGAYRCDLADDPQR